MLTLLQATQLIALGPSLFVIAFLLLTSKNTTNVTIPVLYFLSISCTFVIPLLPLFYFIPPTLKTEVLTICLFIQSLAPALCFLMVIQFILRRLPPPVFWLILALPVIGGSSFIYGNILLEEVCIFGSNCFETPKLMSLYNLFSSAALFSLLIAFYERHRPRIEKKDTSSYHTYCFIMALIALSLLEVAVDLLYISDHLKEHDALMIATLIRIGFVYLVLTSVFKIFDSKVEIDVEKIPTFVSMAPNTNLTEKDAPAIARILSAMEQEHLYRVMGCTRESIADKIGIHEVTFSRIVNQHFHKNFNEFINGFRINEAKERLEKESTPITTIAFEVGFNSIASFNRVFKETLGVSPSDYRHGKAETSNKE